MDLNLLEHFNLPAEAMTELSKRGLKMVEVDGVSSMSGHDNGVAYKFLTIQVEHKVKSDILGYKKSEPVEHIQWFIDRKNKPMERVKELPENLLRFNRLGECVGGKYQESYLRFKEGAATPGTPLDRWKEANDSDVYSLTNSGIFTVEQLAEHTKDRIQDLFGGAFNELWQKAVGEVKANKDNSANEELLSQISELRQQLAVLTAKDDEVEIEAADDNLESIIAAAEKKAAKKVKNKKVKG
tara:strand:+ start:308 stop:1030 length:723 start_codon:yes stop_codon:yes gene_type:complete